VKLLLDANLAPEVGRLLAVPPRKLACRDVWVVARLLAATSL
jgi:hypothetical protein